MDRFARTCRPCDQECQTTLWNYNWIENLIFYLKLIQMTLDELKIKWKEKHSSLLEDYQISGCKWIKNILIQQLLRTNMKTVLEFLEDLEKIECRDIK